MLTGAGVERFHRVRRQLFGPPAGMVDRGGRLWGRPDGAPRIPLMFGLRACVR
jgi:hypothetical protein